MSQNHFLVDFPIDARADADALREELPPLMPDFAKAQDDLGTVHFSRFMIESNEKLLFLSEIDGECAQHVDRLVASGGPVLDVIFKHVDDPPSTSDPERVKKWLRHHLHEPIDTYFAYRDATVQDIKAAAGAAGFSGNTLQSPLLTYMSVKSHLQGFALKLAARSIREDGYEGSDSIGTLHASHWVPFEHNHLGFFTIYDGEFDKYIQDFAEKLSFVFDAVFPHVKDAPPTPVSKNAHAFYEWALAANHPPIGFYSAYPGLGVQDIRALLADSRATSAAH